MENLLLFNILWRLAYTTVHFAIHILCLRLVLNDYTCEASSTQKQTYSW